jgi:hypothetical protein
MLADEIGNSGKRETYYPKFRRQVCLVSLPGESELSRNSLSENTLMPISSFNCGF